MTLFTVLFAIVLIGLMLGLAGRTWSEIMQREREDELLFRGEQYRRAIESYYQKSPGGLGAYPTDLKQLLEDNRGINPIRHLRKLWPEPFSGGAWELVIEPPDKITGVRSNSPLQPFRQDGFDEEHAKFKGAESYSKWEFIFVPKAAPQPPGTTLPPGHVPVPQPQN